MLENITHIYANININIPSIRFSNSSADTGMSKSILDISTHSYDEVDTMLKL